jgi:uncharacterized OsmC-like protein
MVYELGASADQGAVPRRCPYKILRFRNVSSTRNPHATPPPYAPTCSEWGAPAYTGSRRLPQHSSNRDSLRVSEGGCSAMLKRDRIEAVTAGSRRIDGRCHCTKEGVLSTDYVVTAVRSQNTATFGRTLNQIRNHHLVLDNVSYAGGPGEEINATEAFLAGISACAVMIIEGAAREGHIPLEIIEAEIEAGRHRSVNPPQFEKVTIRLHFSGATREQAESMAEAYRQN